MNSFIQALNQRGENFLNFAWPMFWQSSLLILILFAFDFLLRRKLRASIRYALWLIVLIKLILPPTFALPTNPIWWLHQTSSVVTKIPKPNYTVTYDQNFLPEVSEQTLPAFVPPKPELTIAAWLLAISICVSLALLFWMLARWRQVTNQVRRAQFSERITMLAVEAQKFGDLKFNLQPQVKLTANSMSPAVCGLFRPTILIPQSLAENFSDEQLRAVLLHELIHLRRGDVWLNFAQTLLQIFYWWHPLLWFANARIRRVREEAVDDAVMLALRDDAETYAPTLLEVARFALNRPLASLGLVGILESRHALQQRIERLLNFRAPKKVGLTFLSLCGIFIFSAIALPMGNAPTSPNENQIVPAPLEKNILMPKNPEKNISTPKTNVPEILVTAYFYKGREKDFEKIFSVLKTAPHTEKGFNQTRHQLSASFPETAMPRVVTLNGEHATMSVSGPNGGFKFSCVPTISSNNINLAINGQFVAAEDNSMKTNFFDSRGLAENSGGFLIYAKNQNDSAESNLVILINAKIITNSAQFQQRLQLILKKSDVKLDSTNLFERVFKLDTNIFLVNLEKQTGLKTNVSLEARNFFGKTGVNWESPSGKSIFYNDGLGMLFVKATESELDKIEREVVKLNFDPAQIKPQVHIKARFLEVPKGILDSFSKTIGITNEIVGILSPKNFRTLLKNLEARTNVETLAEPEGVTTSGRQMQMRATKNIKVIRSVAFEKNFYIPGTTNGDANNTIFKEQDLEIGPVIGTVANVLSDGETIDLKAIASLTEFFGYATPTNSASVKVENDINSFSLPNVLPSIRLQKASTHVNLYDNQTLVLRKFKTESSGAENFPKNENKELLVFVTVTIVDPAGNRVHSDDEMPFTTNGIPPADSSVDLYN